MDHLRSCTSGMIHLIDTRPEYLGKLLRSFVQAFPHREGDMFQAFIRLFDPTVINERLDQYGD
jgi:hypothetical protein